MSSVGILAWKSALQDGIPVEVPDFRDEAVHKSTKMITGHLFRSLGISKDLNRLRPAYWVT